MVQHAVRSFTTFGYIGAALIIAFVAVLTLGSLGEDSGGSGAVPTDTQTPGATVLGAADGPSITAGPGGNYETIEEAIEAAPDGGVIAVLAGTYDESVYIDRPITLRPAGDGEVWIDRDCADGPAVHVYSGSGVTIRDIGIRNTNGAGVVIGLTGDDSEAADHVTLDGLTIEDFNCGGDERQDNAGIAVWHAGCCQTITGNTITYRTSGEVRGHGNGIWFKSTDEEPSGGGHTISGNVITGGWDGIGGEAEGDDHGSFDRDSVIEGNTVRDCWDDGIQVEGGNVNVLVAGNFISGCGTGIAFAPTRIGPLQIERNVIRDLATGEYDNLFCFKTGHDDPGEVFLTENVCESEGDGIMNTNPGLPAIVSRDNCFIVSRYVFQLDHDITPGTSFDGDYMWTSDPGRFVAWDGEQFGSLQEFREATGHEENGRESDQCPLRSGDRRSPILNLR